MIDIHAHILPGMDDGAQDMYEALEMASIAVESGVTAMVATPHCNIPGEFHNYYDERYIEVFQETQRAFQKEGIPLKLYSGSEVFVTPDVPRLLMDGKILTINGGKYMLVEFGFDEDPDYVNDMLRKLKSMGVRPIIAHPERYEFVQKDPQLAYEWCIDSYLLQLNKSSLHGSFGRGAYQIAHRLLRHNLVSLIASDAHTPVQRTPYMRDVYEDLLSYYPEKYLKVLFEENPRRVCGNERTICFDFQPFEIW